MGIYDTGPSVIIWEMTRACALSCRHCRAEAIPQRDARELSTEEAFSLVDELVAYGRAIVIVTGGDPFMRPDLFEIVEYAATRGLPLAVSPSGTARLTRDSLAHLGAAGCPRISLSIDGPNAATHDAFRGVRGAFDRTIAAAGLARKAEIGLQINTSIGRHNQTQIKEIADVVSRIDAAVWTGFFSSRPGVRNARIAWMPRASKPRSPSYSRSRRTHRSW